MAYSANVWNQIKGLSKGDLVSALEKDGWTLEPTKSAERVFVDLNANPHKRVSIHYHHSKDTFRDPKLLKSVLNDIGWTEQDMKRLKLIK